MGFSNIAPLVLAVVLFAAPASADVITFPAAPGEGQDIQGYVYGEALWGTIPGVSGILDSFSFWLVDPGPTATPLLFRTGVALLTDGFRVQTENRLFETDWRTLSPDDGGGIRQVDTEVPVPVEFRADAMYYLYIVTTPYQGPAWQLQTMGRSEPGGCCGGAIGPGLGLRTRYDEWVELAPDNPATLGETEYDRDIAMTLHLNDVSNSPQAVPEPASSVLMAVGVLALAIFRRRH